MFSLDCATEPFLPTGTFGVFSGYHSQNLSWRLVVARDPGLGREVTFLPLALQSLALVTACDLPIQGQLRGMPL